MCDPSKTEIDEAKKKFQEQLARCKRIMEEKLIVEEKGHQQLEHINRLIMESQPTQSSCQPCPFSPTRSRPPEQQGYRGPPLKNAPGELMTFDDLGPSPVWDPNQPWPQAPMGQVYPGHQMGPRSDWIPPEHRHRMKKELPLPPPFGEPGENVQQHHIAVAGGQCPEPDIPWPADNPWADGPLVPPWAQEEAVQEFDPYYTDPQVRYPPQSPQAQSQACSPCSISQAHVHSRSPSRQHSRSPRREESQSPCPASPPPSQSPRRIESQSPCPTSPPPSRSPRREESRRPCPANPQTPQEQLQYMRQLFGVEDECPAQCPKASPTPRSPRSPARSSSATPSPPPPQACLSQAPRPSRSPRREEFQRPFPTPTRSPQGQLEYMRQLFGVEDECPQASPPPSSPRSPRSRPATPPPQVCPSQPRTTPEEQLNYMRQLFGVEDECPGGGQQSPSSSNWGEQGTYLGYEPYRVPKPTTMLSPVEEAHPVDELGSGMDTYCQRAGMQPVMRYFEPPHSPPRKYVQGPKKNFPWNPMQHLRITTSPVEEDSFREYLETTDLDQYSTRMEKAQQRPCPESSPSPRSPGPPRSAQRAPAQSTPRARPAQCRNAPRDAVAAQVEQISSDAADIIRQTRARLDCVLRNQFGRGLDD